MVAKVRSNISRVTNKEDYGDSQNGSSRVFVYVENGGVETGVHSGKSGLLQCGKQTFKDKTTSTRSDSKGGQRKYGRSNGTRDSKLIEIKGNASRKVLADISNVKTNGLKNDMCDSYKPMISLGSSVRASSSSSSETIMNPFPRAVGAKSFKVSSIKLRNKVQVPQAQIFVRNDTKTSSRNPRTQTRISLPVSKAQISVGTNIKTSSRNPRTQTRVSLPVSKAQISVGTNIKTSSRNPRTQTRISLPVSKSQISVGTNIKASSRNPRTQTRIYLPVSKQAKEVYTDNKKIISLNLDKNKGSFGFPVKPRVVTKTSTHVRDSKTHTGRIQVNNGFAKTSMKSQPRAKTVDLTRKSVKPLAKTSLRIPIKVNVSAKVTSGQKTVKAVGAMKCRRKEDLSTHTSEDSASCSIQDQLTQQDFSNCIYNPENIDPLKRSSRRKSFTSLLIRSKLLEENYGDVKQQTLPSIYDDRNPLEVADYVDDIYQYYWAMEGQSQSLVNYMEKQVEISPQMRGILINWIIEVHMKFDLMQETLYLTVSLFDKFLSLVTIKRNEMQLVGLTVLLLASKYEDFWHPRVLDLIGISAESYTRDQMLAMEKLILKELMFRLNIPTPYVFMLRFLKAAQSNSKLEHLSFYLCELCLIEYEALKFKPSLICASAIYVARCTLHIVPVWNPLLEIHTCYKESQLRDCAKMILRFHKASAKSVLKVTYEKYKASCNSSVATIKPLNKLPI